MIHEDKVKLMTRLAAYEQGEFRGHKPIVGFFRSDYISLQMVKTVIYTTLAYGVMLGMYVLYDVEVFIQEIYHMDIPGFIKNVVILYLVLMGIFLLITYVVYLYRYNLSIQKTRLYYANLKKLSQLYGDEEGKSND